MPTARSTLDPALLSVLDRLIAEGHELWARFDRDVRLHHWHSFVPSEYERVLDALVELRAPGLRFLEWGSATGVIAVMADLLGYEAYGIEVDEHLVRIAVETAARYASRATFVVGSFLPGGYVWHPRDGDGRLGTLGEGASGYLKIGYPLDDFHLVFAYPWSGEEALMRDLMRVHGAPNAGFLLQRVSGDVELWRKERPTRTWAARTPPGASGP